MENIILSLLLIKSMTIYEMKMFIQHSLSTVCSDSVGSIQVALKKLLLKNNIQVTEYRENNMIKKEYSITKLGLKQFEEWIKAPMNLQKVKNMEEGKFFFLGMASKKTRIESLQGYIHSLVLEQNKLHQIRELVESQKETVIMTNIERIQNEKHLAEYLLAVSKEKTLEQAVLNIYHYQVYNLEYGLKRIQEDIYFYQHILNQELDRGKQE